MTPDAPLVSIALPVRDGRRTLPLAVRSIRRQTYPHWELLVLDDGSRDGTAALAARYAAADPRIRVTADGRRLGIAYRLNQAIAAGRGPLFARMDADDVAYPERLERQVAYLRAHPGVDLVGSGAVVFDDRGAALGKRFAPESHEAICARPYAGIAMTHPTFLGRAEAFRALGYAVAAVLDEDRGRFADAFPGGLRAVPGGMRSSEDQEFLMRAHRRLRLANTPEVLLGYREAALGVAKQWVLRSYFIKALYENLWKEGARAAFLRAAPVVLLKFAVDALAITTGLKYRLLGHRALPMTDDERGRWDALWRDLHGGGGPPGPATAPGRPSPPDRP
jgi:glycosyltransferase involved in cell wall biosynthesis